MKISFAWISAVILSCGLFIQSADCAAEDAPAKKPNVLFIIIDDLNDWVGCIGAHSQAKTPNIDGLAGRGTLFLNAHCQAPLCNPSRCSLLTGLRPSTLGIYALEPGIRNVDSFKTAVTLPQTFAAQGYFTAAFGKVFHDGSIAKKDQPNEFNVWGPAPGMPLPSKKFVHTPDDIRGMDWGVFPEDDREQADWKIADSAIAQMKALPADKPFFMTVGFRLPHVPCFASQKWFDQIPETVELPAVKDHDRDDVPDFAWYLHWKLPEPRLSWLKKENQWRPLVRAYLASTCFMDSQIGRVLDALNSAGKAENTLVVLCSDNAWHLGEKDITGKNSLWERATHVPLIFAGGGIRNGAKCSRPAELLDIFPTLLELCGVPRKEGLEGHSLAPQLKDAGAAREWPAITTSNQNNHAVRSENWRYIRYADGTEELYDHRSDPNEWTNVAKEAKFAEVVREHVRWLPSVNAAPAPGGLHRLLAKENGTWFWEGKAINPAEKED